MAEEAEKKPRRRASKELRRRQLILATIESIAQYGLSDTKLSHVSSTAGLSQGIVNLHFKSKESLLVETLKYLRDDYEEIWLKALSGCVDDAAERLLALARVDFDPAVVDRKKLAVWFAFWGETKSRPTYRRICNERDEGYSDTTTELMARLIDEGGYEGISAETVSVGFQALTEGLWLGLHVSPRSRSRKEALAITLDYLARYFPRHAHIFKE